MGSRVKSPEPQNLEFVQSQSPFTVLGLRVKALGLGFSWFLEYLGLDRGLGFLSRGVQAACWVDPLWGLRPSLTWYTIETPLKAHRYLHKGFNNYGVYNKGSWGLSWL